jgi:hypothetical protein
MKQEFLKLYDQSVDEIFEYCYQKTANREIAKSITDKTFTKMWDSITPNYPLSQIRFILHGIAAHLIRQYQRGYQSTSMYA